jgi:hypothetical protein
MPRHDMNREKEKDADFTMNLLQKGSEEKGWK